MASSRGRIGEKMFVVKSYIGVTKNDDLISKSKLMNDIATYFFSDKCNLDRLGGDLREIIDNQPTAYSVDDVIKELEERADFLKDCTKYGNKNAKQQEKSYGTMMMYEVADLVYDLIEIVKKGGVTND